MFKGHADHNMSVLHSCITFNCMDIPNFVYPFIRKHLGCFCFLSDVTNAAVDIYMLVLV